MLRSSGDYSSSSSLQRIKLRVYFVDGACKSLAVTEEATFLDLLYILVNKLSMGDTQPTSKTAQLLSQMFAFFSVTGDNSGKSAFTFFFLNRRRHR
jgi:hypothetical protein